MEKKYNHLSLEKRIKLEGYIKAGMKAAKIAECLNVHISTVYREIKRGAYVHRNSDWTEETRYAAETAHERYRNNLKEKGPELKIGNNKEYASFLENKIIDERYSPEAALYSARVESFDINISVPTLYSYIDKGIFFKLTNKYLLVKGHRKKKKEKKHQQKKALAGTSIEERSKEILKREEFGHWEMDSVVGKQGVTKKSFLVLTERKTREEIIYLLKDHTAGSVVSALNDIEKNIGTENFRKIFKSITVDNGCEFADFEGMKKARRSNQIRTEIFYCHPYSSYERGSNENNNKFIRRFVPKGIDFDFLKQSNAKFIQVYMNNYPRRQFHGKSSNLEFISDMHNIKDEIKNFNKVLEFFVSPEKTEAFNPMQKAG